MTRCYHLTSALNPMTPRLSDVEKNEPEPPPTSECAPSPTIRWDFDYTRDEPPVVQRLAEEPRHSTQRADQRTPSERPRPALELPRPRASSAPPSSHPAKRVALNYLPVTEEITPLLPLHHRAHRQRRSTQPQRLFQRPLHLPRNRGGVGAVAHGAHPRKLPQDGDAQQNKIS